MCLEGKVPRKWQEEGQAKDNRRGEKRDRVGLKARLSDMFLSPEP